MAVADDPRDERTAPDEGPQDPDRAAAIELAQDELLRWQAAVDDPNEDLARLRDRVASTLAGEANHRLRQVLSQVTAQLELLEVAVQRGGDSDEVSGRLPKVLEAMERAAGIVETYLDPTEVGKLLIHLDLRTVDLASLLEHDLQGRGLTTGPVRTQLDVVPVEVRMDVPKVLDVLAHLVSRFQQEVGPAGTVIVRVRPEGPWVRGFIGAAPATSDAHELLEELTAPFDLEGPAIDTPYARVVLERHGGSLTVERDLDAQALGLGFRLPRADAQGEMP